MDTTNPYLCGFGHSRPERLHRDDDRGKSRTTADIDLNIYHHPEKRVRPDLRYVQSFDLYS